MSTTGPQNEYDAQIMAEQCATITALRARLADADAALAVTQERAQGWEHQSRVNAQAADNATNYRKEVEAQLAALIDAKLAPLVEDGARMEVKLHAINLAVDGYVDGAPDAGPVAKLANEVSLIINPPDYP